MFQKFPCTFSIGLMKRLPPKQTDEKSWPMENQSHENLLAYNLG